MERPTVAVYEERALEWRTRRPAERGEDVDRLHSEVEALAPGAPRIDLGCGPGWHAARLGGAGAPVVALDAAAAMLELVPEQAPDALRVQADLEALPFRDGSLAGALAVKCYLHVPAQDLPLALARLHWALRPGAPAHFVLRKGSTEGRQEGDDFPGRFFAEWQSDPLRDVVVGAGFSVEDDTGGDGGSADRRRRSRSSRRRPEEAEGRWIRLWARRQRTLPDTVGPDMRLLVCGLNPSLYAADAGLGFARPGNRFWPAALAAGLVTRDRDPLDALRSHRIGMTDLVKRATTAADELSSDEYRAGVARVERLVRWLRPGAVCFVGLAGWRSAVDRRAQAGEQPMGFGAVPAYVMPSTSGLNAHSQLDDAIAHLRAARALSS